MKFYITFKEFTDNYEKDLMMWLHFFSDGSEENYIIELKEKYKKWFDVLDICNNHFDIDKKIISVKYNDEESPYEGLISLSDLCTIIDYEVKKEYGEDTYIDEDIMTYISNEYMYNRKDEDIYIEYDEIEYFFGFMEWRYFSDIPSVSLDVIKFKNFGFAIKRIKEFLNNRLEELKNLPQQTESLPKPFTTSLEWNAQKNIIGTLFGCLYDIGAIKGTKKDLAQGLSSLFPNLSPHSLLDNINRKVKENEGKILYDTDTETKIKPFLNYLKEKINKK